ncbi:MAG: hypothetical protein JWM31_3228, partial [Solirubrobacterales bacterium]|nr:hypothetical protein [Solirubrobacterales bacterium]
MATVPMTGVQSRTLHKTADGVIEWREVDVPEPGSRDALIKISLSTVCGSDIHYVWDLPMPKGVDGLAMGHEVVGEVVAVGDHVRRFREGDRVAVSCLYSCGTCDPCLHGTQNMCDHYGKPPGYTNILSGGQGEYLISTDADINLAPIPDGLSDEAALLATDIMSVGFAAVERGEVGLGDTVAVFAQGPVGLCATAGARALGAGLVIAVESVPERAEMARRLGANVVLAPEEAADAIKELTGGRGVDVAVEALGRPETFATALKATRINGVVSSVGVYTSTRTLEVPLSPAFYQRKIVTSLSATGGGRLAQLMRVLEHGQTGLEQLFTHRMPLSRTIEAYDLFRHRRDGVLKIALVPDAEAGR